MLTGSTNDPEALALAALGATLSDDSRAQRFLDLTGLDAGDLRARVIAGDTSLLGALVAFLNSHEPDLVAVARTIGTDPATLASLADRL